MAAHHAEPNFIAELVDEHSAVVTYLEAGTEETWTDVVDDESVAGASDEWAALSLFLIVSVDDRAAGNTSLIQLTPWLLEEIEKRCQAANVDGQDFLQSLLPLTKENMTLLQQRGAS